VINGISSGGNKSPLRLVSSTCAIAGVAETDMPHPCEHSGYGRGISRRHALDRMIVASLRALILDTGDADEFTVATAGGLACSRGVRAQGKIAAAA
jgi:hypothetical protein